MSLRTKIVVAATVAVLGVSGAFAGPLSLFASFGYDHSKIAPTGGLRYSLNSDICFDIAAGAALGYEDSSMNGFSLYADGFVLGQTVGVGISVSKFGDADLVPTIYLMYALEKPVNEKITLGISPTLVSYTIAEGNGIDFLSGVNIYSLIAW